MGKKEDLAFGGQAVIEGVMMRSKHYVAVSVRSKGKIVSKVEKLKRMPNFADYIFVRGIVNLFRMLVVGIRALIWSADQQLEKEEKISKWEVAWTMAIAFGAAILLFIILPYYLTTLTQTRGVIFNLIDGVIRVVVFIAYLLLISLMKDVNVLFQYHGAEHMAVHAYEAGKKLTPDNVKKFSTRHPRCGTSFILIVLVISIIVFSFITSESNLVKILARIVLIPVIASVSYELLKLTARFQKSRIVRLLSLPGLWIQKITTRKPGKRQIEVAIRALKLVIGREKHHEKA
ncbi:DUF1385 domain-containing protein [Candidatus Woesearchaeota archaeon]|nr:DUF1385 domain-containing protein [Candidatus Woesearchaeota archaeon]